MLRSYGLCKNGIHHFEHVGFSFFSDIHVFSGLESLSFYADVVNVSDGKLYNQIPFSSDYLIVTGFPGSYVFQCPDTTIYRNNDTDKLWFNLIGNRRSVTENELKGYDFISTFAYYMSDDSLTLESIGIRNYLITLSDSQMDQMYTKFHLSIFWDN